MKNKVGVAITCYNQGLFLEECLDSVQKQTYSNWEICICDAGSTDRSVDIIKEFTCSHKIMEVSFKLNMRLYANVVCPIGVNRWRSIIPFLDRRDIEYIAILDGDDLWKMDKLELQVDKINDSLNCSICYSDCNYMHWKPIIKQEQGYPVFYDDRKYEKIRPTFFDRYPPKSVDILFNMLYLYNYMPCPTLMFRKDVLRHILEKGKVDFHWTSAEDYDMLLSILSINPYAVRINKPLASYRIHSNQLTQKSSLSCTLDELRCWIKHYRINKNRFFSWQKKRLMMKLAKLYLKCIYKTFCEVSKNGN